MLKNAGTVEATKRLISPGYDRYYIVNLKKLIKLYYPKKLFVYLDNPNTKHGKKSMIVVIALISVTLCRQEVSAKGQGRIIAGKSWPELMNKKSLVHSWQILRTRPGLCMIM